MRYFKIIFFPTLAYLLLVCVLGIAWDPIAWWLLLFTPIILLLSSIVSFVRLLSDRWGARGKHLDPDVTPPHNIQ